MISLAPAPRAPSLARTMASARPPDDDAPEDGLDYVEPPREPLYPTDALPGSKAKKRVMRRRIRSGESPFHPLDRRLQEDEEDWLRKVRRSGLPFAPSRKGESNG